MNSRPLAARDLELETCSVAVTPFSVVLTVKTAADETLVLTMPRHLAESVMRCLEAGLDSIAALSMP